MDRALEGHVETIRGLLPPQLKPHAERMVKRAMLEWRRKPLLQQCTPQSFLRCVLAAAELGLMVDGRLGYAVPYKDEAQFQASYKGLIVVARRSGLLKDVYADVVYAGDHYRAYREDGGSHLIHEYKLGDERGQPIGAYAVGILGDGLWHYEQMDLANINRIKSRSRAKDKGPWVTDEDEMRKKTILRRLLKLFEEDPAIALALELDDKEYESPENESPASAPPPTGRTSLRGNGRAATPEPEPPLDPDPPDDDAGHAPCGRATAEKLAWYAQQLELDGETVAGILSTFDAAGWDKLTASQAQQQLVSFAAELQARAAQP